MKALANFILIVLVLGALSWALWHGFKQPHEGGAEVKTEEAAALKRLGR